MPLKKKRLAGFVVSLAAAFALSAGPAAAYPDPANKQQTTVVLGMDFSADSYLDYKINRSWQTLYPVYTWTTDGCSTPWYLPFVLDRQKTVFNRACVQHDFCYRNAKRFFTASVWSGSLRVRCDSRFLTEMYRLCDRQRSQSPLGYNHPLNISAWRSCRGDAEQFHWGVRTYGS